VGSDRVVQVLAIEMIFADLEHEGVALRTAAVELAPLLYGDELRLVLQADALRWTELHLPIDLYEGAKLRALILEEQPSVFVHERAVVPADADLLHDHVGVAVPSDGYFVVSQPDE
jgi:hypothetical protein